MSLQVELLEQSFEEVKPQANKFAGSFYENLFTANPEAKPLFEHTNMAKQQKMLLNSLVMVVENLRKPDVLSDTLRGLGARHVKYGALPAHYPLVGGALLTTFEQYLKEDWTPEVKQAWVDAYGAISEIMLDGADYSEAEIALPPTTAAEEEAGLDVELLEQSFEEVKLQANKFAGSFYENLFTANPEAKPLFEHTDMASQKKMLLNSLVMVVENLRKPDILDKALRGLGARHVKYGALPEHYPLVGDALLTTFEQYLQEDWTPKTKAAWVGAYGAISEIMLDGADYSEQEIALPATKKATAPAVSGNTEIASLDAKPLTTGGVNGTSSNTIAESGEFKQDSGKAVMAAFAGGGIMGVIVTILAFLL